MPEPVLSIATSYLEQAEKNNNITPNRAPECPQRSDIERVLDQVDADNLTPKAALELVYQLKGLKSPMNSL